MINWTFPAIAFGVAAMLGAWLNGRSQQRPGWSKRRRVLLAALPLPLLAIAAGAAGVGWELLRLPGSTSMTDLAIAVYVGVGAGFALLSFGGGLFGALLAERKLTP